MSMNEIRKKYEEERRQETTERILSRYKDFLARLYHQDLDWLDHNDEFVPTCGMMIKYLDKQ